MAITMYQTADEGAQHRGAREPESVRAHAVDHQRRCPHGKPGWPDTSTLELTPECVRRGCRIGYVLTFFAGRVLSIGEHNRYHDSDFFAMVWTDGGPKKIEYASTRGWSYFNGAKTDATPEVLKAYGVWQEDQRRLAVAAKQRRDEQRAKIRAAMPAFGQTWQVESKRSKVPYGTLVDICDDPQLSGYAPPLQRSETPEERYQQCPSNFRVRIRVPLGDQAWVSCSVLRPWQPLALRGARP